MVIMLFSTIILSVIYIIFCNKVLKITSFLSIKNMCMFIFFGLLIAFLASLTKSIFIHTTWVSNFKDTTGTWFLMYIANPLHEEIIRFIIITVCIIALDGISSIKHWYLGGLIIGATFAFIESAIIPSNNIPFQLVILRVFLTLPMHMFVSALLCSLLKSGKKILIPMAFIIPLITHILFNAFIRNNHIILCICLLILVMYFSLFFAKSCV